MKSITIILTLLVLSACTTLEKSTDERRERIREARQLARERN